MEDRFLKKQSLLGMVFRISLLIFFIETGMMVFIHFFQISHPWDSIIDSLLLVLLLTPFLYHIAYKYLSSEIRQRLSAQRGLEDANLKLKDYSENLEKKLIEKTSETTAEKHFLEGLIKSLPGIFYLFDDSLRFKKWNKRLEELSGYSGEEIGRMTPLDLFEKDRDFIAEKIHEVFDKGEATAEAELVTRDKREIPFFFTGVRDEIEGRIHIIGTGIDITEKKHFEESLLEIKHDWEDVFNTLADMITVHDKDYNIIKANTAAEKVLNLSFLNSKSCEKCFAYYHGTEKPPEGCPSCQSLITGKTATFELFEPHLGMFLEIRAIPRFNNNQELVGLIHVVRDITERKKMEEAIKKKIKDLQGFYEMAVERELKMKEMKKEIERLRKKETALNNHL